MNLEEIKQKLEDLSKRKRSCDDSDFDLYDCCGSNFDDAYSIGFADGSISMARELFTELNK